MTDNAYGVAYLYLHLLEKVIGRAQLLGVLHDYFQTYKIKGGTLHELTTLLESRYAVARAIDAD
jgi:hypothetical protein